MALSAGDIRLAATEVKRREEKSGINEVKTLFELDIIPYRSGNLKDMSNSDNSDGSMSSYDLPEKVMTPWAALGSDTESVSLSESVGRVSGEFVICYPPGIPLIVPGELVTQNITDRIFYLKEKGCTITGTKDPLALNLSVLT